MCRRKRDLHHGHGGGLIDGDDRPQTADDDQRQKQANGDEGHLQTEDGEERRRK